MDTSSAPAAARPAAPFLAPVLLFPFLASSAAPEEARDDLVDRIGAIAAAAVADDPTEGLSIVVDLEGETLVSEGWGYADTATGDTAHDHSPYRAGCLTDPLVAVGVLLLAEQGRLDLDDELSKHLPAATWEDETVRLRHLLTQTSGIASYGEVLGDGDDVDAAPEPEVLLARLTRLSLEFTPGECFSYSPSNTWLLGLVLERHEEMRVPDIVTSRLFEPLELEGTTYAHDGPPLRELSAACQEAATEIVPLADLPRPFDAFGLCTTAGDQVRFLRALTRGDVVTEATWRRMVADNRLADGTRTGFGLGFNLVPLGPESCISYGGGLAGSRVHVAHYPSIDLTIAVFASGAESPVDDLERSIARAVFGMREPGVLDLPLAAEERARFVGDYYHGCSRIGVIAEGERLRIEPPDGPTFTLLYQGELRFVAEGAPDVVVTFTAGDDRALALVLDRRGVRMTARRLE